MSTYQRNVNMTATPSNPLEIILAEGRALQLTPSSQAVASFVRYTAAGAFVEQGSVALKTQIGPFSGAYNVSLSVSAGSVDALVLLDGVNAAQIDPNNGVIKTPSGTDANPVQATPQRGPLLFIGDSRTQFGQPYRRPGTKATGAFDGRTVYITSGTFNASTQWIAYAIIDGTAALNSQGIISSDSAGLLSYAHAGDSSGPKVDVSTGGWFYLQSGTNGVGITIAVRGNSAKVLNAGGTYATSGFPLVWDYDLRGHIAWIAGAFSDTFSDYRAYAIPGASTADVLKFIPQAFTTDVEAAVLACGVNDIGDTGSTIAQASAAIANLKAIIDYANKRVKRLYVCDVWQAPNKDSAAQRNIDRVNTAIREYCRTAPRTRHVGSNNQLVNFSATGCTAKTGTYFTDNLHLVSYGAYRASINIIAKMRQDYPSDGQHKGALDLWDSTLMTGALNPNPTMVGTTGTGSGSNGVTGTVPTSWSITRAGATQTCVGAIEAATDGGHDWYTMTVTGATAADYHQLQASINPIPTGVAIGDYYRIVAEIKIGAMTTPGIAVLYMACTGNGNTNNDVLIQLQGGWNIDTFTTENPILSLTSEPQKLLALDPMTLRLRVGGAVGGGGTIGIRNFRIEKVAAPITL